MSNKPYYRSAITCIAATIAALSGPLSASEVGLEEIIVTAQKRSESVQDVPVAISALVQRWSPTQAWIRLMI